MNPMENMKEIKSLDFFESLAAQDIYELICVYSEHLKTLFKTPLVTQNIVDTLLTCNMNLQNIEDLGEPQKNTIGNLILLLYCYNSEKIRLWQKNNGNKTYPIKPIVVKKTTLTHSTLKIKKIKHKSFNEEFMFQNCTISNLTLDNCKLIVGNNNFFDNCNFKNCYFYDNFLNNNNFDKCYFHKTYTYLEPKYAEYTLRRIEQENHD